VAISLTITKTSRIL